MALSPFDLECRRQEAARSLPTDCFNDFLRLSRTVLHGPAFQWLLVDAPHEGLRKQVMSVLDGVLSAAGLRVNRFYVTERHIADANALERRLVKNAAQAKVVHVLVSQGWFTTARWDAFNVRRERLASQAKARLVFWLDEAAIQAASQAAPDLWAWRGGVYAFKPTALTPNTLPRLINAEPFERKTPLNAATLAERHRRVVEIQTWLKDHPDAPDELLVAPFDELGQLLFSLGELDNALDHWKNHVLPLAQRHNDAYGVAIVQGRIADVLQAQSNYDEAMRIHREEQLPVFERLGDQRALTVTMGQIADVFQLRGELDEALRIRREEQLPVFERLGDEKSCAITRGQIADVLQARGDFDEALLIRIKEELPVYERLGEHRERAVAMGQIAAILQARGNLDEALRIHREEELPIFERLGDQQSRAITMGQIALVLQAKGELSEALRIHREEVLPVYERLGDQRSLLIGQANLASLLLTQGSSQAQSEARQLLQLAHEAAVRLQLPEAKQIADIQQTAFTHDSN